MDWVLSLQLSTGSHWKQSLLSTRSPLTNSEVIPSISDHEAIYIEASLCPHKTPTQSRTVSLYKKADFEAIREGLRTFYSEMPDPNTVTTDELWSSFKDRSQSLITKHVPSKVWKGQKNHRSWINQIVKTAKKKTFKLYTHMKKSKKSLDIRIYKFWKSEAQKYERLSYHSYTDNLIEPDWTWFGKQTI